MASKFPEYKYGGKKSDYEIQYQDAGSGRFFKSIVSARKQAIAYEYNYLKYNPTRDARGDVRTWKHQVCYIDAYNFHKYKPEGTSLTYRQQSGKPKTIGYVLIRNDSKTDNKDVIFWVDKVKKADSRVINKEGQVVRKLTKEERAWF